jgi:hypothetical protein
MVAAIEIYNKPRFDYRDEVFVLLLINAWELLVKAMLSKGGKSIFAKKRRNQPYRTLSWQSALARAVGGGLWPSSVPHQAIDENLDLLTTYRDNAVHFYNAPGFGVIIYSLAQTSIINYRDVLRLEFRQELTDEINWHLMPLGVEPPIDPITYLGGTQPGAKRSTAVDEYLAAIRQAAQTLEDEGIDTGRLLTSFDVSLQSTKKVTKADITVGVDASDSAAPVIVTRKVDPNLSHPYLLKDVIKKLKPYHAGKLTSYVFQAAAFQYSLRDDGAMCWKNEASGTVQWSPEVVARVGKLSSEELDEAKRSYRAMLRAKSRT